MMFLKAKIDGSCRMNDNSLLFKNPKNRRACLEKEKSTSSEAHQEGQEEVDRVKNKSIFKNQM